MNAHALALIPAYRLGWLEPDETLDVREHLRAGADCRNAFEAYREPSDEEERRSGHLPIALLARWDAFAPLLTEDERTCLETHLGACPRCTESRAFARLAAELPEQAVAPARRAWLGFGTAAMAAVLAVAVVVSLRERPAPHAPASTPAPVAVPRAQAPALRAPSDAASTRRAPR